MKVLLTGGNGFVAGYTAAELIKAGHTPVLSDLDFSKPAESGTVQIRADLLDSAGIEQIVREIMPDACIHLGGITSVVIGNRNPPAMFQVNVTGTAILLEAFRKHCKSAKFLFVSTAHVYGPGQSNRAITESDPLQPASLYAISKACADTTALFYATTHGMHVMTARPNNHVGPGQSPDFVLGTFSTQIKAISRGNAPAVLNTGNLESTRDFTDVRDVAKAYRLLIEKGTSGQAYNIGSAEQHSIKSILDTMCSIEGIKPEIKTDPARLRPADKSPILDTTKISKEIDWHPETPFDKTLRDIMQEF